MFCLISKTIGILNDDLEIVNGQQLVGLGKYSADEEIGQSIASYMKHVMNQDIEFMKKKLHYKIQHSKHNDEYVMTLVRTDEDGDSINVMQVNIVFTESFDIAQTKAAQMEPQDEEGRTLCLYALNYPLQLSLLSQSI